MRLIYECPESFWDSLTTPMDTFPKLFWCAFVRIDSRKFEIVALTVPEIIAIGVLVGVCEPWPRGRGVCRGSWMVPFERALVTSYRPSIVNFPLVLTHFRDTAAFGLQHTTFPIPPLVSPKFLHVPLRVSGWPLGYEEQRCWANCSRN